VRGGQQQREVEAAVLQLGRTRRPQPVQRAVLGRGRQRVVHQYPGGPLADRRTAAGEPSAQAAVEFGGGAGEREATDLGIDLGQVRQGTFRHRQSPQLGEAKSSNGTVHAAARRLAPADPAAYTAGCLAKRCGAVLPSLLPTARTRRRAIALLACLLGVAALAPAQAATRDYYFTPIGSEQGLAQNSVTAMVQDAQGFVWVATQGGLHRYDGSRYVAYRHDPGDTASLPESFVTALAIDPDANALWVGLYSRYLARIDLGSGRIQRFALDAPTGDSPARQVSAVLPRDGFALVGTLGGLERFEPATGERRQVLALPPDSRSED